MKFRVTFEVTVEPDPDTVLDPTKTRDTLEELVSMGLVGVCGPTNYEIPGKFVALNFVKDEE